MSRRESLIILRLVILAVGLIGGGLFLVAPLWSQADQAAEERRALAADQARLDSEWAAFAAHMAEKGQTAPLNSVSLPDSLLSQLLLNQPLPPPTGLLRASATVPEFLAELARLGTSHDIDWTSARTLGLESRSVTLASGEQLPIQVVRFEVIGRGAFAATGRAIRAISQGAIPVRVLTVAIQSAPDDLVDATLTLEIFGAP